MQAWLASVDDKLDGDFYLKMNREGYKTLYQLRYEYEDLTAPPFKLRVGTARALWAATLAIRKQLGYPWVDLREIDNSLPSYMFIE